MDDELAREGDFHEEPLEDMVIGDFDIPTVSDCCNAPIDIVLRSIICTKCFDVCNPK